MQQRTPDPIQTRPARPALKQRLRNRQLATGAAGAAGNMCAVRAAQMVGIPAIIDTARKAGIMSPLAPYPPLALGASAASPLEMAGAYSTLARGGVYVQPTLVRRIEGKDGFLREYKPQSQQTLPVTPIAELVSCMESVVKEGTGVAARLPDRPVAGKTGTSDEARDLWFVGFTPDMVTAIWGGNDQHHSLGNLTGGTVLAGIWRNYNQAYYRARPKPPGQFVVERNLNLWQQLLRPQLPQATAPDQPAQQPESSATQQPQPQTGTEEDNGIQQQSTPNVREWNSDTVRPREQPPSRSDDNNQPQSSPEEQGNKSSDQGSDDTKQNQRPERPDEGQYGDEAAPHNGPDAGDRAGADRTPDDFDRLLKPRRDEDQSPPGDNDQ
jgi:membrane peptidoglycan carboxypeptidase